jgi:hypothetical protein
MPKRCPDVDHILMCELALVHYSTTSEDRTSLPDKNVKPLSSSYCCGILAYALLAKYVRSFFALYRAAQQCVHHLHSGVLSNLQLLRRPTSRNPGSCQVFCPGIHTLSALGPGDWSLGVFTQSLLTPGRRDAESAEFVAEAAKRMATPASVTPYAGSKSPEQFLSKLVIWATATVGLSRMDHVRTLGGAFQTPIHECLRQWFTASVHTFSSGSGTSCRRSSHVSLSSHSVC